MRSCDPPIAQTMERDLRLVPKEIKLGNSKLSMPVSYSHNDADETKVVVPTVISSKRPGTTQGSGNTTIHVKRTPLDDTDDEDSEVERKKRPEPVLPKIIKPHNLVTKTPLGVEDLHMFSNPTKSKPPPTTGAAAHGVYSADNNNNSESDSEFSEGEVSSGSEESSDNSKPPVTSEGGPSQQFPEQQQLEDHNIGQHTTLTKQMTKSERRQMKYDILSKLNALERKGIPLSKRFTSKHKLVHIQAEYNRLTQMLSNEAGVKFGRKLLMGAVGVTEWVNERFDPVGAKLEGWSESVMENIEDFDRSLERIVEKWNSHVEVAPEMELMTALAGSAFMFHMSKSILGNPASLLSNMGSKKPNAMASMMQKMMSSRRTDDSDDDEEEDGIMSPPSIKLNPLRKSKIEDDDEEDEDDDSSEYTEETDESSSDEDSVPRAKMVSIPNKK